MPPGKWCEVVLFEEIIDAFPKKLRYNADVIPKVEPFEELDAFAANWKINESDHLLSQTIANSSDVLLVRRVILFECFQHPYLNLGGIAVFGYRSNDLDSH